MDNIIKSNETKPVTHLVCPTETVEAPVELVWSLLTQPAGWGDFFDVRVTAVVPAGPAIVGQIVEGESGPRLLHLKIVFRFDEIDTANRKLGLIVRLPFGITVREDMNCAALGADRCRVNYRCGFGFPAGWRGAALRLAMRREIDAGPLDSITRLKRAAEKLYREKRAG